MLYDKVPFKINISNNIKEKSLPSGKGYKYYGKQNIKINMIVKLVGKQADIFNDMLEIHISFDLAHGKAVILCLQEYKIGGFGYYVYDFEDIVYISIGECSEVIENE